MDKQRSTKHIDNAKDRVSVENHRPSDGICIESLIKYINILYLCLNNIDI